MSEVIGEIADHAIVGTALFETRHTHSNSVKVNLLTLMRLVGFDDK